MLNDVQVKNLKHRDKLYRKADSGGLAIEIAVSGSKIWVHRYRYQHKATMMVLGHYPSMSLLSARQARDINKQLLNKGINPKDIKIKASSSGTTFNDVFLQWHNM